MPETVRVVLPLPVAVVEHLVGKINIVRSLDFATEASIGSVGDDISSSLRNSSEDSSRSNSNVMELQDDKGKTDERLL